MAGAVPHAARVRAVDEAFRTLPERYLGAGAGFDATYRIVLGDVGQSWEVRATTHGARVRKGGTRRTPDVTIGTDAATWLALRQGELSGVEAYSQRLLYARGDLDLAVGFEGLFRLPNGRPPLLRIHDVRLPGRRVSTLTMGDGPDVLLIHGLGATKSSFFDTAAALTRSGYRVHALDLPGFGSSSKPLAGPYSARWFADSVVDVDGRARASSRAHLVGNSMGGRVAIEVGLRAPERVKASRCCAPRSRSSAASGTRSCALLRPEFGLLPHNIAPRARSPRSSGACSPTATRSTPPWPTSSSTSSAASTPPRARGSPSSTAARNIYLERPFGRGGFYPRLADLDVPALFVWGTPRQARARRASPPRRQLAAERRARSSSRAAATCPRSSVPRRRSRSSRTSSPQADARFARRRPARGRLALRNNALRSRPRRG